MFYYNNLSINPVDMRDKAGNARNIIRYFLARTNGIFKYGNLPDTIPHNEFEMMLQVKGYAGVAKHEDKLYAYGNELGSDKGLDEYYRPTIMNVTNPAQNLSKTFRLDEDMILVKSDTCLLGLLPIISKYATLIAENELSLFVGQINTRLMSILKATDDNSKKACDTYLSKLEAGELAAIVDDRDNLLEEDNIKVQPASQAGISNNLVQLTEIEQFLVGSLFREIGLKGNNNMKRENISEVESQIGDDTLIPLIDDMLKCRKEDIEKVNAMFGTNITVELNGIWKIISDEAETVEETVEVTTETTSEGTTETTTEETVEETVEENDDTVSEEEKDGENNE